MSPTKFEIPPEFQLELQYEENLDTRTDDEIVASLKEYQPVDSEKNIWAFWDSGLENLPPWTLRNIISWARINGPSWKVRLLDSVPNSPNNALKYVPASYLPESFVEQTMTGPYIGPHSSDFLRGPTLYLYGGAYVDVGNIPIAPLDLICWNALSDPSNPHNIAIPLMYTQGIANHFVAARKGDPFIKRWHDLFISLWQGRTDFLGIVESPLLNLGENFDVSDAPKNKFTWDFNVAPEWTASYIAQIICWTRLCMLEPPDNATGDDKFNTSEYWLHHILTYDVLQEGWAAESILDFPGAGEKIFDILATRLDADPESDAYKIAYKVIWRLLTGSSMQKVIHGKGLTNDVSLGTLLDRPENEDADCAEGTFGELLRYGAVHFRQTRKGPVIMEVTLCKVIVKKGLLEP